jgi:2-keto-4-pentenoate hydratase/2-oxohepta-3-ene-1,7-dioic acid hydratase in catechol pathway
VKLASFAIGTRASYGPAVSGGFVDAGARVGAAAPDLLTAIATGRLDDLRRLSALPADVGADEIRWRKPIESPGKTICVGVNYRGRNEEYKDGATQVGYPSLFLRVPQSFAAHQEPLVKPPESPQYDYEGEIAVVIGERGRRIREADALSHIAGYTVCNEGTVRDWCKHGKFNVTAGKNFERSGSIGPWLVTSDAVGSDPLRVITRVNGEVRQDDTTDRMLFPIPALIAYISTFMPLDPGDIIVTGTPTGSGVRFDPPRFLIAGDVVEVEVPGVGTLVNTVVNESLTEPSSERLQKATT